MSLIEKAAEKLSHSTPVPLEAVAGASGTNLEPQNATAPENTWQAKVDLARLRGLNIITPNGDYSATAEEFRMVKRPLLNNAFGADGQKFKNANLIMVTSCFPGEGKSFCTLNLAMSFAMEMDRTVLLVDADVSKPTVLSVLGIEAEKGLLDLLEDKDLNPSEVLIKTSVPNLTVLPAGRRNANATELLASESMARLLDDLAHRYHDRVILFDSPPLLVTTEASVLSTHMGQIVMVIEAGKTPQPAINAALGMVSSCGYVGLLLNKAESRLGFDKYGYGYGYGYGRS